MHHTNVFIWSAFISSEFTWWMHLWTHMMYALVRHAYIIMWMHFIWTHLYDASASGTHICKYVYDIMAYIWMCVFIGHSVQAYIWIHTYMHISVHACIHTHIYTYMYTCATVLLDCCHRSTGSAYIHWLHLKRLHMKRLHLKRLHMKYDTLTTAKISYKFSPKISKSHTIVPVSVKQVFTGFPKIPNEFSREYMRVLYMHDTHMYI